MKKIFNNFILFLLGSLFLIGVISCKKSNNQEHSSSGIYVAGSIFGTNGPVPVYWKNGAMVKLAGMKYGEATSITKAGSDVYIAGRSFNSEDSSVITYWKNGLATFLPNNIPGLGTGIAVSGTDIYVSGYKYNFTYSADGRPTPAYWKNGLINTLSVPGNRAQVMAVAAEGGDLYFAGYTLDDISFTAMYWKNGVMTSLGRVYANSIAVSESDIYVAGDSYPSSGGGEFVASCWKNGLPVPLAYTDPTYYPGHANAVTVSGNDVYVAGYSLDKNGSGTMVATYWKNGIPITLSYGMAKAIFVSGPDVYVAGNMYNTAGLLVPAYWKNGKATTLPGNGSANAIIVITP